MSLAEKISQDLIKAMKSKDDFRLSCLRMVKTALKNEQVAKGHALQDEEAQGVIQSMIRKAQDAASEFRAGNRESMALKEEREVQILYEYLPKQMGPEEIDLGKVMKAAMPRIAGRAQGKEVNDTARRLLS